MQSGSFGGSGISITANSDVNGVVTEPFTANTLTGTYTVSATTTGVAPTTFSLTNSPGVASSIAATSGTPQSVSVGNTFGGPLVVTVLDQNNNPVPGVIVNFQRPPRRAPAAFSLPAPRTLPAPASRATP